MRQKGRVAMTSVPLADHDFSSFLVRLEEFQQELAASPLFVENNELFSTDSNDLKEGTVHSVERKHSERESDGQAACRPPGMLPAEVKREVEPSCLKKDRPKSEKYEEVALGDTTDRCQSSESDQQHRSGFDFSSWYKKLELWKLSQDEMIERIREKFESLVATGVWSTKTVGSGIDETCDDRNIRVAMAKMLDGSMREVHYGVGNPQMHRRWYMSVDRWFVDMMLSVAAFSATASSRSTRCAYVAKMLCGLSRVLGLSHCVRSEVKTWLHRLVDLEPLDLNRPSNCVLHLQRCDGLMWSLRKLAHKTGCSDLYVCSKLYQPPGTVWRRDVDVVLVVGKEANGLEILGRLERRWKTCLVSPVRTDWCSSASQWTGVGINGLKSDELLDSCTCRTIDGEVAPDDRIDDERFAA